MIFLVKPIYIEILVTSLVEMIELPIITKRYEVITFISKNLYFKEVWYKQICWGHEISYFWCKVLMTAEQEKYVTWFYIFGIFFRWDSSGVLRFIIMGDGL